MQPLCVGTTLVPSTANTDVVRCNTLVLQMLQLVTPTKYFQERLKYLSFLSTYTFSIIHH